MFDWLKKKQKVGDTWVDVVEPPKVLVVSEPVISLIASLKRIDEWELENLVIGSWCRHSVYKFTHITHNLVVSFRYYYSDGSFECAEQWPTIDEREALCTAIKEVMKLIKERSERLQNEELVAVREKFMVLVEEV